MKPIPILVTAGIMFLVLMGGFVVHRDQQMRQDEALMNYRVNSLAKFINPHRGPYGFPGSLSQLTSVRFNGMAEEVEGWGDYKPATTVVEWAEAQRMSPEQRAYVIAYEVMGLHVSMPIGGNQPVYVDSSLYNHDGFRPDTSYVLHGYNRYGNECWKMMSEMIIGDRRL